MDQNSVLKENMEEKNTADNLDLTGENGFPTPYSQRLMIPEVSNLISSVDRLTSQNFKLLKIARISQIDIEMG